MNQEILQRRVCYHSRPASWAEWRTLKVIRNHAEFGNMWILFSLDLASFWRAGSRREMLTGICFFLLTFWPLVGVSTVQTNGEYAHASSSLGAHTPEREAHFLQPAKSKASGSEVCCGVGWSQNYPLSKVCLYYSLGGRSAWEHLSISF